MYEVGRRTKVRFGSVIPASVTVMAKSSPLEFADYQGHTMRYPSSGIISSTLSAGRSSADRYTSGMEDHAPHEGRKYAIYVLGAGFSVPAGIPAASELWRELLARGLGMGGRAGKFRDDLDAYIRYRDLCDGIKLTYETINLEELLGFLDIEHHLGSGAKTLGAPTAMKARSLSKL